MSDSDSMLSSTDGESSHLAASIAATSSSSANKRNSSSANTNTDSITLHSRHSNTTNNTNNTNTNQNSLTHTNGSTSNESALTTATLSCNLKRSDQLDKSETRDLLVCAVYVLRHVSEETLLGLWCNYEPFEFARFLGLLRTCLRVFKYRGRRDIQSLM